jgi:hypothetical protein
MNLEHANPEIHQPVHVARGVGAEAGMHPAVRQQPLRVGPGISRREVVGRIGEAHDVGARVIDEPDPPHPGLVHDLEQRLRIVHQGEQEVPVVFLAGAHHRLHFRLQVPPGLDMDVDIGDAIRQGRCRHASPQV